MSDLRGILLMFLCASMLMYPSQCRSRRRKFGNDENMSEDFEFADDDEDDEDDSKIAEWKMLRKQTVWNMNQESRQAILEKSTNPPTVSPPPTVLNYCSMVRCPAGSKCVTKGRIAICIPDKNKGSLIDDEDDNVEEELVEEVEALEVENHKGMIGCNPCSAMKSSFICGSDNKTYSSSCRLSYHNCVEGTRIEMACLGLCPCNGGIGKSTVHKQKIGQINHRWNKFVSKYEMTVDKLSNKGSGIDGHTLMETSNDKTGKQLSKSKISSVNPSLAEDKEKQQGHNSVLSEKLPNNAIKKKDCSQQDLEVMGNRLLDWFSVVMADAKRNKSRRRSYGLSPATFPGYCKQEVKWMFHHLDQNSDAYLSLKELYDLEHETHEHCLKPFLEHCDVNKDMLVSSQEWCKCFDRSEKPCTAARNRLRSGPRIVGSYNPDCDETGYYRQTQCHPSVGHCWCVDKHGVEYANTRARGRPDCESLVGKVENKEDHLRFADDKGDSHSDDEDNDDSDDDDEDDDDDDDEEEEGSADKPLDI